MKNRIRRIRRVSIPLTALVLSLLLSGCSWFFVPSPTNVTEELPVETTLPEASSEQTVPTSSVPFESSRGAASETAPEVTTAAGSAVETGWHDQSAAEESTAAPEAFTVDYYRTPEILRAVASDAVFTDAYNVIGACLSYRTSVKVGCEKADAERVIYIADTLCPLLKAFTDIDPESWTDGEMHWNFYVGKEEFAGIRAAFESQVAAYIEPFLDPVYNETERALLIYHAYTKPAEYNYEIISGSFKSRTEAEKHRIHSAYAGIVDHRGVCHDLAGGMTFLFIQAGFNAARVTVINKDDEHSWTLIELDGRYTYCDATWDVGGYFSYFGNSPEERAGDHGGSFSLADMNIFDYNAPAHFDIVNPGFAEVQNFSYVRYLQGVSLSLAVNTELTPHRLRFRTIYPGDTLTVVCP